MPKDRANIDIGTPQELRAALMKLDMNERPRAQRIANLAVRLERRRIIAAVRNAPRKK